MIELRGFGKDYGDFTAVESLDLSIGEGEMFGFIGPNGAGKTTLVRIILGLLQADSGSIFQRPDLRIGYMPQKLHIEPNLPLTVLRFLQLALRSNQSVIDSTLIQLNISHLLQQQLVSISGGELQRVLLARALLRNPHILILDEPAQGVDLGGQAELYQLISELSNKQGCGVLMISHDLHLVMSATDEVICLNHHVCCHGKPEHVSNDPAYLDLFGANASQNVAVYTHHHNHEHDITGNIKTPEND